MLIRTPIIGTAVRRKAFYIMEIILIVPLIVLAGVFAMAEIALVSVRKPRLQQWAAQGNTSAQVALDLANKPETFLATVQMGMTLIGIFAGAFGERTLSIRIESYLNGIPRLAPYGHVISLVTVVGAVTYVTLIIGELVPKQIALHSPERFASALAKPMMALSRVGAPIVTILNASASVVLRAFRIRPSEEPLVTEEEIKVIMEQGAEAGLLEKSEHETVRRLFRLSDRAVMALMKPRHDIVWLDVDAPAEQTMKQVVASSHSRFPVARSSLDNIVGMVKEKDLLACCMSGRPLNLTDAANRRCSCPARFPHFACSRCSRNPGRTSRSSSTSTAMSKGSSRSTISSRTSSATSRPPTRPRNDTRCSALTARG